MPHRPPACCDILAVCAADGEGDEGDNKGGADGMRTAGTAASKLAHMAIQVQYLALSVFER